MSHNHATSWQAAEAERLGIALPECRFRTRKACDENLTQFNHGHLGHPCVKELQESKSKRGRMNSTPTCILIVTPSGQSFDALLKDQLAQAPQSWHDELEAWKRKHGGTLDAG